MGKTHYFNLDTKKQKLFSRHCDCRLETYVFNVVQHDVSIVKTDSPKTVVYFDQLAHAFAWSKLSKTLENNQIRA